VPLDTWFHIAVFPDSHRDVLALEPLYLQAHRLHSGKQHIVVRVAQKPGRVAVDPFRLMIDRVRDNNVLALPASFSSTPSPAQRGRAGEEDAS